MAQETYPSGLEIRVQYQMNPLPVAPVVVYRVIVGIETPVLDGNAADVIQVRVVIGGPVSRVQAADAGAVANIMQVEGSVFPFASCAVRIDSVVCATTSLIPPVEELPLRRGGNHQRIQVRKAIIVEEPERGSGQKPVNIRRQVCLVARMVDDRSIPLRQGLFTAINDPVPIGVRKRRRAGGAI